MDRPARQPNCSLYAPRCRGSGRGARLVGVDARMPSSAAGSRRSRRFGRPRRVPVFPPDIVVAPIAAKDAAEALLRPLIARHVLAPVGHPLRRVEGRALFRRRSVRIAMMRISQFDDAPYHRAPSSGTVPVGGSGGSFGPDACPGAPAMASWRVPRNLTGCATGGSWWRNRPVAAGNRSVRSECLITAGSDAVDLLIEEGAPAVGEEAVAVLLRVPPVLSCSSVGA